MLAQDIEALCGRLIRAGWGSVFAKHGLDLDKQGVTLRAELDRELPDIDRSSPGFEDFALEGTRAIEPGAPARSLLYHGLASPHVKPAPVTDYPTLYDLDLVENYVFARRYPSVAELRAQVKNAPLAIVAFTGEYRPAIDTVHQRHADMCFARTGVSRVGTIPEEYSRENRGFAPFADGNDTAVRVIPCRYSFYLAACFKGNFGEFGPMRFQAGDASRDFWVPIHKLFDGTECIRDHDIRLEVHCRHRNEKLRRVHLALLAQGYSTGWSGACLGKEPFVFEGGIAQQSGNVRRYGPGLIVPIPHDPLIEEALNQKGQLVTFEVPRNNTPYSSSFNIVAQKSGTRSAPEYVHARHKVGKKGQTINLNRRPDVVSRIAKGGYRAKHYKDFTGDGWIRADCPSLALEVPRRLAAYSIVAPPDFFPFVKQKELMDWWEQSAPPEVYNAIWPTNPGAPRPLSDGRYPANLTHEEAGFHSDDTTITALVTFGGRGERSLTRLDSLISRRVSSLPDRAAGVFAPGWDCSIDRTPEVDPNDDGRVVNPGVTFLAAYGLGSPFPEDTKLCAALSSFWPAAAPDIARVFEPWRNYATATPLPDDIIGQGGATPWDGIPGPMRNPAYPREIEYSAFAYGDYVDKALERRLQVARLSNVDFREYAARTLVMERVYKHLNAETTDDKKNWCVFSFTTANSKSRECAKAQREAGKRLASNFSYRFKMFRHLGTRPHPKNFTKVLVRYEKLITLYADPTVVLFKSNSGRWEKHEF